MAFDVLLVRDILNIVGLLTIPIIFACLPKRHNHLNITPWIEREVWSVILPLKASRTKQYLESSLSNEQPDTPILERVLLDNHSVYIDWDDQDNNHFYLSRSGRRNLSSAEGRLKTYKDGSTLIQLRFGPNLLEQVAMYTCFLGGITLFVLLSPRGILPAVLSLGVFCSMSFVFSHGGVSYLKQKCREAIPLTNVIDLMMPFSEDEMRLYEKLRPLHWVKGHVLHKIAQNTAETLQ
jgi:hypothetical protein